MEDITFLNLYRLSQVRVTYKRLMSLEPGIFSHSEILLLVQTEKGSPVNR